MGRNPVVLQLSDTQIIDAGQTRPGRDPVSESFWGTDKIEERCYDYLTEVITATNPDFIIITGDVGDVTAAVEAGAAHATTEGLLNTTSVIAAPHPELWEQL